jgi:hypothetical protein
MGHGLSAHRAAGTLEHSDANLLSDAQFIAAFETCTLSADVFRHYEHVRVAWIYLGVAQLEEATQMMAAGIRRFALHHSGSDAKYNEGLTRAWVRVVARAREMTPSAPTFTSFAKEHPMLFDRKRAFEFYGVEAP